MDGFLPAPRSASDPLVIPLLGEFRYICQNDDFTSKPSFQRAGNGAFITVFDQESISKFSPRDRASCLQSWLFFGLIAKILTITDPHSNFVESSPKDHTPIVVVKSVVMNAMVRAWAERVFEMDQSHREAEITAVTAILDFAAEEVEHFDSCRHQERFVRTNDDIYVLAAALLSIRLLIGYLRSTIQLYHQVVSAADTQNWLTEFIRLGPHTSSRGIGHILANVISGVGGSDSTSLPPVPPGGEETLSTLLLLDRLTENGWCSERAKKFCRLYDYLIVNYFSRVRMTNLQTVAHSKCEAEGNGVCIAHNLTPEMIENYVPKHTLPSCSCSFLDTSLLMPQMIELIKGGFIPVLSIESYGESLYLKVHKQDGTIPYTAISHVWSDGRGNPHQNSLPLCQLQKLAEILRNMERDTRWRQSKGAKRFNPTKLRRDMAGIQIYFWMDTLCIPVGGDDMREVKRLAIMNITPIFSGAESVLVLDSDLEFLDLGRPSGNELMQSEKELYRDQEELTTRILGSKWIQRAWTLEEGALARDCHFLVQGNRTLSLGSLVPLKLVPRDRLKMEKKIRKGHASMEKSRRKKLAKHIAKQRAKGFVIPDEENSLCGKRPEIHTMETPPGHTNDDIELGALSAYESRYDERSVEFDVPLKLLLAGPLNENRKQAVRAYAGKEEYRRYMKTRGSQFVDAWNDLLDRSATKINDPVLIFANILDFNAAAIQKIQPVNDQLPAIIKSCQELPIGLLFNSGRFSELSEPSNDFWLPSRIAGDRLSYSATLRRSQDVMRIDLTTCKKNPLLILHSQCQINYSNLAFCIKFVTDFGEQLYVVEALPESVSAGFEGFAESAEGLCILIDPGTGTRSLNGYSGRGAQFSVTDSQNTSVANELHLKYRGSVKAWTLNQWLHSGRSSDVLSETLTCSALSNHHQNLTLEYDVDNWNPLLTQRQILPLHLVIRARKRKMIMTFITYLLASIAVIFFIGYKCTGKHVAKPRCDLIPGTNRCNVDTSEGQNVCVAEIRGIRLGITALVVPITALIFRHQARRAYAKWLTTFRSV